MRQIKLFIISYLIIVSFNFVYSQQTTIYIDCSASMQGYLSNRPDEVRNLYQQLFFRLRENLVKAGLGNYQVKRIKANLQNVGHDVNLPRYGSYVNFYNGTTTNLYQAINDIIIDDNKVNLIITDGVASNIGMPGGDCSSGYDLACILKAFNPLIGDDSVVVWIMGIKSYFKGIVYSEVSRMLYGTQTRIDYEGLRPFYIYFIANINSSVENLIGRIYNDLNRFISNNINRYDSNFRPQLRLIKIYPLIKPTYEWKFIKSSNILISRKNKIIFSLERIHKNQYNYILNEKLKQNDHLIIPLEISLKSKTLGLIKELWSPKISYAVSAPGLVSSVSVVSENGKVKLELTPKFTRYLEDHEKNKISIVLQVSENLQSNIHELWNDWGTDDDTKLDDADKTLNMNRLLGEILKISIDRSPKRKERRNRIIFSFIKY